jgi:DNA-binding response OmpR family regulator
MMSAPTGERLVALIVSPWDADHEAVVAALVPEGWRVHQVTRCSSAIHFMEKQEIPVVITERDLPDGNWQTLFNSLEQMAVQPKLIVTSPVADDKLWSEVLNLGAADVLAQPFCSREIFRSVCLAYRQWQREQRNNTQVQDGPWVDAV